MITCPGNLVTTNPVQYPDPTVSDNFDPTPDVNCNPQEGMNFVTRTTTVTCIATDEAGNSASCMFTVTLGKTP